MSYASKLRVSRSAAMLRRQGCIGKSEAALLATFGGVGGEPDLAGVVLPGEGLEGEVDGGGGQRRNYWGAISAGTSDIRRSWVGGMERPLVAASLVRSRCGRRW